MKFSNSKYLSKLATVVIFIIFIVIFMNYFLHHFSFNTPIMGVYLSEKSSHLCASLMRKGVKIQKQNEGFTSGFRQMYRPHIRNARLVVENYYNSSKNNLHLILKKVGFM